MRPLVLVIALVLILLAVLVGFTVLFLVGALPWSGR